MDSTLIIGIGTLFLAAVTGTGLLYYFVILRAKPNLDALRAKSVSETGVATAGARAAPDEAALQDIKKQVRKKNKKKEIITLDEKFFQAGVFSEEDKREFYMYRTFLPAVAAVSVGALCFSQGGLLMIAGAVLGGMFGMRLPYMMLDRKIKFRQEDILFFLPLVIEQIVIGVSSSLDIGPCLQRVVMMADERDTHNCVTELLRVAQHYMRSGMSLEDAMVEVGRKSGHTELKHAFMSLSQVARHGGEISKQLQELADAVSNQREARIETKIKKLELEATLPVAMVFCGFLLIILVGFGMQIKGAFK